MSPRSSEPSGSNPPDVYVALLVVSVAALCTGITFLVMELNKYGWSSP